MKDTPVVGAIMALCGVVFVLELVAGNLFVESLAMWPLRLTNTAGVTGFSFQPWQILTYAFLHGSVLHLVLNMYALWLFGVPLERRWGSAAFAGYYFACVIGAAVVHLIVAEYALAHGGAAYPVVGASGGIFGLLLAIGKLYPDWRLLLLFPPVPIKARWFVVAYGAVELIAGVTGTADGIAHFAHLGGMLTGYLMLRSVRWLR